MKIYRIARFDGEWWIIDGDAIFADGDVGDVTHEGYAIQHAQSLLMDGDGDWDCWKGVKTDEIERLMCQKEKWPEERANIHAKRRVDPELFFLENMENYGVDQDTFLVANGNGRDVRLFAMQKWGWKRMAGRQITTWTLTANDLSNIASGIDSAYGEEIYEMESRNAYPEFNIEVSSKRTTYWNVPVEAIIRAAKVGVATLSEYATNYSLANQNGLIIKNAQFSSILYYGGDKPNPIHREDINGAYLTPAPNLALNKGQLVSAYQLQNGEYFIPDMMDSKIAKGIKSMYGKSVDCQKLVMQMTYNPTQEWIKYLNGMGYDGFISGDYIYVFDKKSLRYMGVYDFQNRNVRRT